MYTLNYQINNFIFLLQIKARVNILGNWYDKREVLDSEIIGMIQQYLDKYVENKIIANYVEMWANIKKNGSIESEKSAIIGQLYGGALRLLSNLNGYEESNINLYDLEEFNELFTSRLNGIEKRIEKVLIKNHTP